MLCLNSELKEISLELNKYNLSENPQNWKSLLKSTGEFHRNYRAFYMMVIFLSGEAPREDLSHVEMQMEVRKQVYWSNILCIVLNTITNDFISHNTLQSSNPSGSYVHTLMSRIPTFRYPTYTIRSILLIHCFIFYWVGISSLFLFYFSVIWSWIGWLALCRYLCRYFF